MGAESFEQVGTGKTIEDAFRQAVEQARWDYGHSGYSGTIAEKGNYTVIEAPEDKDPCSYANELMLADDARITDKWGPAGAIQLGPEQWLFFGWASS